MKKYLLSCLLLTCLSIAHAQSNRDSLSVSLQANNEVKINILYSLLGTPELTYERILTNKSAVGVSVFIRAFQAFKSDFKFGINPYYRRYFGYHKASGFFLEGHGVITTYERYTQFYSETFGVGPPSAYINKTIYGIGGALGAKFLTRKGFTGEIYAGVSQTFGDSLNDVFPRAGLTLGKRF
jgi:hypothetical protein